MQSAKLLEIFNHRIQGIKTRARAERVELCPASHSELHCQNGYTQTIFELSSAKAERRTGERGEELDRVLVFCAQAYGQTDFVHAAMASVW